MNLGVKLVMKFRTLDPLYYSHVRACDFRALIYERARSEKGRR
jgi:hypothetical protein